MILDLVFDGVAVGSIYALVSVGLVLVFRTTGALNFAHGDIMMISTFVAFTLLVRARLPLGVALLATVLFAAALGVVTERLVVRRLMTGPRAAIIMATLGISYILQGTASQIWTDDIFSFPRLFPGSNITIGSVRIVRQNLGVFVTTLVIFTALHLFLTRTKTGMGLRALTQNPVAATLMGVRVTWMYALSWAIGASLAAVAGILLAPTLFLSTAMGGITFTAVICAIIGGFGSIYGAIVGGYLVGILSSVIPVYIPSELAGMIPFGLLMIVLFLRPTGILGRKTLKKV